MPGIRAFFLPIALTTSALMLACAAAEDAPASAVQVEPATVEIAPSDTVRFAAFVPNEQGPLAWEVEEQGGGVIDECGNYTAPSAEGTYHVVASVPSAPSIGVGRAVIHVVSRPPPEGVAVVVAPRAAALSAGGSTSFSATVTGTSNGSVAWSVLEGAAGGTVTAEGTYTAPQTAGTYHVVATSVADTTRSGTATVTVTSAPPIDPSWVDVRSFGAVGDGVHDDTAAFRDAAATRKNLRVPRPPAHYKITGKVRIYGSMSGDGNLPEIRMYGASGREEYSMIEVIDYQGPSLVISGLRLDGQWNGTGTNGEWSHNILVKGSSNVTIENNVLERPYGDNILVGGENFPKPSVNVVIRNNEMSGPRRCNVALIWSREVLIQNNVLRKASSYVTAIDLEPNPNGYETVWDTEISNNQFDTSAVGVMLYHLPEGMPPGGPGGNVAVTGNTGRAGRFVQVGPWTNVSVTNNTAW